MIDLEYRILKLLSEDPHTVDQIKSNLSRFNKFRIDKTIEDMEDSGYIEELFDKEFAVYKTQDIDELSGSLGNPTGQYLDTKDGLAAYEEERAERFKFYMPFIYSAAISLVTVIISVISLCVSLSRPPV